MAPKLGNIPWNKGKAGLPPSWNKGRKLSEQHRKNLLRAKKIKVNCGKCGKEMIKNEYRILNGRGKFCSKSCAVIFNRTGSKHTDKTKKKMSEAGKGKILTIKQKEFLRMLRLGKKNPKHSGEKCNFWKGGVTSVNAMIRSSMEYRLWRESVFKRDNYTCIWGGKEHGNKLNADHIKSFSQFPELRFAIDNGRTLCAKCHQKTDNYGFKAIKK